MEESTANSGSKWKYLVFGVLLLSVFVLSVFGGYQWTKQRADSKKPTSVTDGAHQQNPPGPITLAVISELDVAKLQDGVDALTLEKWWQIIGVDSQALTLRELGGTMTYTPSTVKIVFKDITPLSVQERAVLYKPVSGMPGTPIMAGLSTESDSDEFTYVVWYAPELLADAGPADAVEDILNRQLFEVLYEAVIGSTELTRDDYDAKLKQVLPTDGAWGGIVKLVEGGQSSGQQPQDWAHYRQIMFKVVDQITGWRLVRKAYAQSCGGGWKCGGSSYNCLCSTTGNTCVGNGTACDQASGTCNCSTICVQESGGLNNCNVSYGVCKPPGTNGQCSQCLALNTCYTNDQDDDTPPAGCGNAVCSNGETCSTCPADCGACAEGRHVLVMLDGGVRELVLRADTLAWELRDLPGGRRAA